MITSKLRALSIALVLGTAAVGGHGYVVGAAHAATVRSVVGKPLQQAQALAAKGDYSGALAAVNHGGCGAGQDGR